MQPAVFIARLAGPLLVVIGVGVLLNEANYAAMIAEAAHSPTLIYLSGLLTLPLGIAILNICPGLDRRLARHRYHPRLALGDRRRDAYCAAAAHRDAGHHAVFNFGWTADLRRRHTRVGRLSQFRGVSLARLRTRKWRMFKERRKLKKSVLSRTCLTCRLYVSTTSTLADETNQSLRHSMRVFRQCVITGALTGLAVSQSNATAAAHRSRN